MKSPIRFGPKVALAAIALGFGGAAIAQSAGDTSAGNASTTTSTATVTPQQPSTDLNATIGSTALARSDSANAAFEKLDTQSHGFLSRSDLSQLPGFGNAFAQADRDRDGRLDRTEFTDAWSSYIDQSVSVETTTTTITQTQ